MEKLRALTAHRCDTQSDAQAKQLLAEVTTIVAQLLVETVRNDGVPDCEKQALLEQAAVVYEDVIPKYSDTLDESLMSRMVVLMHYILKLCYIIIENELRSENMESIFYLCTSCSERSDKHTGALVKDLLTVYRPQLEQLISVNDISYVEYLFDSFQSTEGFLRKKGVLSTNATDVNKAAAPTVAVSTPPASIEEQVETIKSIFNNYGDQFIISCLLYFDNDSSRVINALLEDNLPPQLANLDRNIQRVWIGKGGGKDNYINRYSNENSNNINQIAMRQNEQRYKQIEKERIRALERQEEDDKLLISREYGDDYDDQYDNVVSSISGPTSVGETAASKRNNHVIIDWGVRMKETKRINSLIKQEEENLKYWQDLTISNKLPSDMMVQGGDDEGGDDSPPLQPSNLGSRQSNTGLPKGPSASNSTAPNTANNTTSNDKTKFRTKRFDKHHQKDKANRKYGTNNG